MAGGLNAGKPTSRLAITITRMNAMDTMLSSMTHARFQRLQPSACSKATLGRISVLQVVIMRV